MISKSYTIVWMVLIVYFLQNIERIGADEPSQGVTVEPSKKPGWSIIKMKIKKAEKNIKVEFEIRTKLVTDILKFIRSKIKTSANDVEKMFKEMRAMYPKLKVHYDKAKNKYHVTQKNVKTVLVNIKQGSKRLNVKAKNLFEKYNTRAPKSSNEQRKLSPEELMELYKKWELAWLKFMEKIKKMLKLDKLKPYLTKAKKTFSDLTTSAKANYKKLETKTKNTLKKNKAPNPT